MYKIKNHQTAKTHSSPAGGYAAEAGAFCFNFGQIQECRQFLARSCSAWDMFCSLNISESRVLIYAAATSLTAKIVPLAEGNGGKLLAFLSLSKSTLYALTSDKLAEFIRRYNTTPLPLGVDTRSPFSKIIFILLVFKT